MNELMAKHTGRPVEQIERDIDRDRFMSAEEAKEYGLIDNVDLAPRRARRAAGRSAAQADSQSQLTGRVVAARHVRLRHDSDRRFA